jgi:hypothetical protein
MVKLWSSANLNAQHGAPGYLHCWYFVSILAQPIVCKLNTNTVLRVRRVATRGNLGIVVVRVVARSWRIARNIADALTILAAGLASLAFMSLRDALWAICFTYTLSPSSADHSGILAFVMLNALRSFQGLCLDRFGWECRHCGHESEKSGDGEELHCGNGGVDSWFQ